MADSTRSDTVNIIPLRLGRLTIGFPVGLAPMAGISNSIYRSICKDFNCGFTFTETISSIELIQQPLLSNRRLIVAFDENPLGAQIFGCSPEEMAESAKKLEDLGRFEFIDINCGCPARRIVAKGAGAALMKKPELIRDIVSAVSRAVSIPVTIKTRIGISPHLNHILEIAQAAEDGGACAISIHARYAKNKHSGPADWGILREIKSRTAIPIIGNGGINNAEDAVQMLTKTGVDGLMIGRAAIGNPWIFKNIDRLIKGEEIGSRPPEEVLNVMIKHLQGLIALMRKEQNLHGKILRPEYKAVLHFRAFLKKYLEGFECSKNRLGRLMAMNSPVQVMEEVKNIIYSNGRVKNGKLGGRFDAEREKTSIFSPISPGKG
jgi:tRNA-dihydrouridine synthase B